MLTSTSQRPRICLPRPLTSTVSQRLLRFCLTQRSKVVTLTMMHTTSLHTLPSRVHLHSVTFGSLRCSSPCGVSSRARHLLQQSDSACHPVKVFLHEPEFAIAKPPVDNGASSLDVLAHAKKRSGTQMGLRHRVVLSRYRTSLIHASGWSRTNGVSIASGSVATLDSARSRSARTPKMPQRQSVPRPMLLIPPTLTKSELFKLRQATEPKNECHCLSILG